MSSIDMETQHVTLRIRPATAVGTFRDLDGLRWNRWAEDADGETRARGQGKAGMVFNEVSLRPAAPPKC